MFHIAVAMPPGGHSPLTLCRMSAPRLAWSARNLVCSMAVWLSSPRRSAAVWSRVLKLCHNECFIDFTAQWTVRGIFHIANISVHCLAVT